MAAVGLVLSLLWALLAALPLGALPAAGEEGSSASPSTATLRLVTRDGRLVLERSGGDGEAREPADSQRRMETWNRRWHRQVEPVHRAAEELKAALAQRSWRPVRGECRQLGRALEELERDDVLPAPNYAVHRHLVRYLHHLTRATVACLGGRPAAVAPELRKALQARYHASLALRRWDLSP